MPFFPIPYGKGTGKLWLFGILILIILCACVCGFQTLVKGVNSGEITNPVVIILAKAIYPFYKVLIWLYNCVLRWGILAIIPICVVVVAIVLLMGGVLYRIRKIIDKRRYKRTML